MRCSTFSGRAASGLAVVVGLSLVLVGASSSAARAQAPVAPRPDLGSAPTQEDLGNLAWTSGPSGKDLPPGQATAKQGATVYANRCAMCHGQSGEGGTQAGGSFSPLVGRRLGGGTGTPTSTPTPGRVVTMTTTVPWATALFNAIAVEMPFFRPGTLTPEEVYGATAFILFKNGLIEEEEVMNRETLPKVQMPNRAAFPQSDEIYMDQKKRGCIETYGICRDK